MTPQDQQIAIAEACGWDVDDELEDGALMGHILREGSGFKAWDLVPDYLNDLNTIHEAVMNHLGGNEDLFYEELARIVNGEAEPHWSDDRHFLINATAPQRAEAYLKAINRWTDK